MKRLRNSSSENQNLIEPACKKPKTNGLTKKVFKVNRGKKSPGVGVGRVLNFNNISNLPKIPKKKKTVPVNTSTISINGGTPTTFSLPSTQQLNISGNLSFGGISNSVNRGDLGNKKEMGLIFSNPLDSKKKRMELDMKTKEYKEEIQKMNRYFQKGLETLNNNMRQGIGNHNTNISNNNNLNNINNGIEKRSFGEKSLMDNNNNGNDTKQNEDKFERIFSDPPPMSMLTFNNILSDPPLSVNNIMDNGFVREDSIFPFGSPLLFGSDINNNINQGNGMKSINFIPMDIEEPPLTNYPWKDWKGSGIEETTISFKGSQKKEKELNFSSIFEKVDNSNKVGGGNEISSIFLEKPEKKKEKKPPLIIPQRKGLPLINLSRIKKKKDKVVKHKEKKLSRKSNRNSVKKSIKKINNFNSPKKSSSNNNNVGKPLKKHKSSSTPTRSINTDNAREDEKEISLSSGGIFKIEIVKKRLECENYIFYSGFIFFGNDSSNNNNNRNEKNKKILKCEKMMSSFLLEMGNSFSKKQFFLNWIKNHEKSKNGMDVNEYLKIFKKIVKKVDDSIHVIKNENWVFLEKKKNFIGVIVQESIFVR